MALRRLINQVRRQESQLRQLSNLAARPYRASPYTMGGVHKLLSPLGTSTLGKPNHFGSLARRLRESERSIDAAYLKELSRRNDPEEVIRLFESHPSLHANPSALAEYVKALVRLDRLDESELFRALRRGATNSLVDEESVGALSAFRNVGKSSKDGFLGTSSAPIHMVTAEGGYFKELIWRTIRALGVGFLLMSGFGALIEDRGIGKGLGLHEEVRPIMESNTKFSDVKGVDEAKAELEEIVHYLRDPKHLPYSLLSSRL